MKRLFKVFIFSLVITGLTAITFYANAEEKDDNKTASKDEVKPVKLDKESFLKLIWDYEKSPQTWKYKGDKPAIIDFYADWCGPCRKAAPVLDKVAKDYKGKITVYKIDTQRQRELASVFNIKSIPAFLYIPVEGKPVMTAGTGRTDADTRKMFETNIQKILLKK